MGAWKAPSFRVLDKIGFRRDHSTLAARSEVVWMVRDSERTLDGVRLVTTITSEALGRTGRAVK